VDFPVTRGVIAQLPDWVNQLAGALPAPLKAPAKPEGFRWDYPIHNAETVQVAKAVRMASGIAAALYLADRGFTVECYTLLRTVSDFASEVVFLAEGLLAGRLTEAQTKFVDDYFTLLPTSPDELAEREREYYVARKKIYAAHARLFEGAGLPAEEVAKLRAYLDKGYDSYVHGAYQTAMELYRPGRFMMTGHESAAHRCVAKAAVAGKLHEVVVALGFMARTRKLDPLLTTVTAARLELTKSEEESGTDCRRD
jgi:hypothetical protein